MECRAGHLDEQLFGVFVESPRLGAAMKPPSSKYSNTHRHRAAGLGAVLLCGCADVSMPAYRRPDTPPKAAFSQKEGGAGVGRRDHRAGLVEGVPRPLPRRPGGARHRAAISTSGSWRRASAWPRRRSTRRAPARCRRWTRAPAPASRKTTGPEVQQAVQPRHPGQLGHRHLGQGREGRAGADGRVPGDRGRLARRLPELVSDVSTTYFQILQLDEQSRGSSRRWPEPADPVHLRGDARERPAAQHPRAAAARRSQPADQRPDGAAPLRATWPAMRWPRCSACRPANSRCRRAACSRPRAAAGGAGRACRRSCWSAGPTSSPPNSACWKPTTWWARPSWRNCRRSA